MTDGEMEQPEQGLLGKKIKGTVLAEYFRIEMSSTQVVTERKKNIPLVVPRAKGCSKRLFSEEQPRQKDSDHDASLQNHFAYTLPWCPDPMTVHRLNIYLLLLRFRGADISR
jgi:hypothetical protein